MTFSKEEQDDLRARFLEAGLSMAAPTGEVFGPFPGDLCERVDGLWKYCGGCKAWKPEAQFPNGMLCVECEPARPQPEEPPRAEPIRALANCYYCGRRGCRCAERYRR